MLAPIYFVIFVLMAQFVLVNVVVAVLMKHLDESNKMMADDAEMDEEIEKQLEAEARNNIDNENTLKLHEEVRLSFFLRYGYLKLCFTEKSTKHQLKNEFKKLFYTVVFLRRFFELYVTF
jgi:hypothetical protein